MASFDELFNAVKQAQNRGGGVREAATGFADQFQTGTANRQARLKAELERLTLESDKKFKTADDIRQDAALQLSFADKKRTTTLTDASGKPVGTLPGLSPEANYIPGQGAVGLGGPVPTAPKVLPQEGGVGTADPQALLKNLDEMERILATIPSGPVQGRVSSAAASLTGGGMQTNTKLYNDFTPAMATGIYRAVTKDTRLSDADAQARALPLIPKPSEDPKLQKKKIAFIRMALQNELNVSPDAFSGLVLSLGSSPEPATTLPSAPPATSGLTQPKAPQAMTDEELQAELQRLENAR